MEGKKKVPLLAVFKRYTPPDNLSSMCGGCSVETAMVNREKKAMEVSLLFDEPQHPLMLRALRDSILETYDLDELTLRPRYPAEALCERNFARLVDEIKAEIPCANGFFTGCGVVRDGDGIKFTLRHGGLALLEGNGCAAQIQKLISELYGVKLRVSLECGEEDGIREIPIPAGAAAAPQISAAQKTERTEKREKKPAPPKKPKQSADGGAVQGELVFGKPINGGEVTAMGELNNNSGKVTVCGDVFSSEIKKLKDGRMRVVTFEMTDYTGSVHCERLIKGGDEEFMALIDDAPKKRLRLKVRGDVEYSRFFHDIVLKYSDICICEAVEPADDAGEKRVELHLHTNMSEMDGINGIEEYINMAAKWGHKAIAVTDHGVVQAFPEAMKAAKKAGIKVIYGVESYFVNDTHPAMYGFDGRPFDGEFIMFDIETTGLKPDLCGITEIGAVRVKKGEVVDEFDTFVNPETPIPAAITELTGISDDMVRDAPDIGTALDMFYGFCGKNAVLVAHNANFDAGFMKVHGLRCGRPFEYTYIDTLALSRFCFPELKKHKLDIVAEHLKLPPFKHHRACDDARVLAGIWKGICDKLRDDHGLGGVSEINSIIAGAFDWKRGRPYHQIIIAKDQTGLKNLYKLISYSHLNYFFKRPRIPKSLLMQYRDGLLIGSACDAGELYCAVLDGRPWDELTEIARFYDYLEIQPLGNCRHLISERRAENEERLKDINRTIIRLGRELGKPVVATGDVHFLRPRDAAYRAILMAGKGFDDADEQAPLYLRTTNDMLREFSYLGEELAYEVVVKNTNLIADMVGDVRPISPDKCPPHMENAEQTLISLSEQKARAIYGDELPEIVSARMKRELDSIVGNGYAVMYMIAQKLVEKSLSDGYLVGSRGSVGSSFVAFLSGITEVNSLCPHYVCPKCRHSEFIEDGSYGAGCDMPDRDCPVCGERMKKDGFNIPFETFLGFEGDKEPDIDLNFSGEYQSRAHKYTEVLFGEGYVFRAGTIGALADKTAYGYVKKYLEERGRVVSRAEENRLAAGCTGIKRTTGQHPGGVIICPKDREIFDFCPIQHPANDVNTDIITTHFDYHSIDKNLLKLDILGHDDPTMIRMLEDITGVDARNIPLDDEKTMGIFTSTAPLGIEPDEITTAVGTIAIPEFGTRFARQMLIDTKPTTFIELVDISGLSHGTDVWVGNAQDLIKSGTADLMHCICTRDDIMGYLIAHGLEKKKAFNIMEAVRKGNVAKHGFADGDEEELKQHGVPDWYIDSCKKIGYMFPKAHAVAYVTMAFRIAWFKVHMPDAFYAAYFSVRADSFDAEHMIHGDDVVTEKIRQINSNKEATPKEKDMVTVLEVCHEMYMRGLKFVPIDIYKSDATRFLITDEGILPPLNALSGLGDNAAAAICRAREEGEFATHDDLRIRAGVPKSVVETLDASGVISSIPKSSQLSLF